MLLKSCLTDRLEGKKDSSTIIDFNTLLSTMDRTTTEKISKELENANNTVNKHAETYGTQ